MVKLHSPFGSLHASGSVAKAITASTWKGRAYLKAKGMPTTKATLRQRGARVALGWLGSQWNLLTDADRQNWEQLARPRHLPPYNTFASFNLTELFAGLGPTKQHEPAHAGTLGEFSPDPPIITSAVHAIEAKTKLDPINDGWGVMYFISPDEAFTPDLDTLFLILTINDEDTHDVLLTPLPPARWWVRCKTFTTDGVLSDPTPAREGISLSS